MLCRWMMVSDQATIATDAARTLPGLPGGGVGLRAMDSCHNVYGSLSFFLPDGSQKECSLLGG